MKKKKLYKKIEQLQIKNAELINDLRTLCTSEKFTDVFTVLESYRMMFEFDDLSLSGEKTENIKTNNGIWQLITNDTEKPITGSSNITKEAIEEKIESFSSGNGLNPECMIVNDQLDEKGKIIE